VAKFEFESKKNYSTLVDIQTLDQAPIDRPPISDTMTAQCTAGQAGCPISDQADADPAGRGSDFANYP
jgi:hypothetical protein